MNRGETDKGFFGAAEKKIILCLDSSPVLFFVFPPPRKILFHLFCVLPLSLPPFKAMGMAGSRLRSRPRRPTGCSRVAPETLKILFISESGDVGLFVCLFVLFFIFL